MTTPGSEQSFAQASAQLDAALDQLEASVRELSNRMRAVRQLESEAQRLAADRDRLTGDLGRERSRADRLDDAAGEVSRRLVDAMETVKSVIETRS